MVIAEFEEWAFVAGIFFVDAFGNGLRAFELRAGIEVAALLAGMHF